MSDEEKCTEGEFSEKFEELRWNLLNAYRPTLESAPQAFLLGGQSGAGKTTLHKIVHRRLDGNGISINGDDYRKFHPRFLELQRIYGDEAVNYTAPWAGRMTEALIDSLSRIEYNLVIEGTLRTAEVPLKTAELLRQRSYGVSLALMAVKPEISLVSCQIRYEEIRVAGTTPRATDPAHHNKIIDQIVSNLGVLEASGMFDEIALYDRSQTRLFPRGSWRQRRKSLTHHPLRPLDSRGATPLQRAQSQAELPEDKVKPALRYQRRAGFKPRGGRTEPSPTAVFILARMEIPRDSREMRYTL